MDEEIHINIKEAMKYDPLIGNKKSIKNLKIYKGEKIIHIKATSKRVAHKRRIKGAKPKVEIKSERINSVLENVVSYY